MELNTTDKMTPGRLISRQLKKLRESANLSYRELGSKIQFSHPCIVRVERGEQVMSEALAKKLDAFFDPPTLFVDLLEAAHDGAIRDYGKTVVTKERSAVRIQSFASSLIPGLLQTEDYALELFRAGLPGEAEDELKVRVDARMKRKRIFDADEPPYYWSIVDESALARPVGGKECMCGQLEYLLCAAENPYVTVQVLPFAQGAHPMLGGSLTLLALKEGGMMGLVESFKTGDPVESPRRVAELVQLFEMACSKALPKEESGELIRRYLKECRDEG